MSDHIIRAKFNPNPAYPVDLLKAARDFLEEARVKTAAMLKAARGGAARQIRRARKRAARLGAARARCTVTTEHAVRLAGIETERRRLLQQAKQECLELCLLIAREILGAEIAMNRESLAARIQSAIDTLINARAVSILVNPADLPEVRRALCQARESGEWLIEPRAEMAPGKARLESPAGTVDLDWEAHLCAVAEAVRRAG